MSDNNLKEVFDLAVEQVKTEFKKAGRELDVTLWFKMEYLEDNIQTIKVSVPSGFMWQQMLNKNIISAVKEKIINLMGLPSIEIECVVNETSQSSAASSAETLNPSTNETKSTTSEQNEDKEISGKNNSGANDSTNTAEEYSSAPKFSESIMEKKQTETEVKKNQKPKHNFENSTLNPNFTFENFITGDEIGSKFAYNVAYAAAQNPGQKTNPILIYGGVGIGKTHLMQAIGNEILNKSNEPKKICYIQTESFMNEFTASIINKTTEKFKQKYRSLDVLLLDDIQFLNNKNGLQEELFYAFEALHKKHAQMVFASDRPLTEIGNMAERLVSRLGSGMCMDMHVPNVETRKAIIHKKLENKDKALPDDIIDCIARSVETNVRDLESALNKIIAYTEFIGPNITLEIVQQQLSNIYSSPGAGNVSIENILKVVADNYQISVADIKGKKRDKKYAVPRHIAIYIARELTEYAFTELGNEFGGRDHSSIMHAYNNISEKIQTDSSFLAKIKNMMEEVKKFKG